MRLNLIFTVLVSTILSRASSTKMTNKEDLLTLERIDAISDLSAIAEKYFAEESEDMRSNINGNNDTLKDQEPQLSSQITTSMIFSLSELWKQSGSTAYTLTRLAQLIDEKDETTGKLSLKARVIRILAERSNDRKVYMTTAERSEGEINTLQEPDNTDDEFIIEKYRKDVKIETAKCKSNQSLPNTELAREASLIDDMYRRGNVKEADKRVKQWIKNRWLISGEKNVANEQGLITAFTDINESGTRGHYLLLSALIRLGREESKLLDFTPETKAAIVINLLKLPNFKISPSALKWLVTVDTYKEDQIKLLRLIEHGLDKGQFMKNSLNDDIYGSYSNRINNNILDMFEELWRIDEMNSELQKIAKDKSHLIHNKDVNSAKKETDDETETDQSMNKDSDLNTHKSSTATLENVPLISESERERSVDAKNEEAPVVNNQKQVNEMLKSGPTNTSSNPHEKLESQESSDKVKATETETADEDLDIPNIKTSSASQYVVLGIIGLIILTALSVYAVIKNKQVQRRRRAVNIIGAGDHENMMENALI